VSRPPEASDSDSGIVDLNAVREKAQSMPEVVPAPAASSSIFDDDKDAGKPGPSVAPKAPKKAAVEKKSSVLPLVGGVGVAVLAMAAAFVLVNRANLSAPPPAAAVAANAPAAASAAAPMEARAAATVEAQPAASGLPVAVDNKADDTGRAKVASAGGAAPGKAAAADDSPDKGTAAAKAAAAPPAAAAGAPATDLGSAMAGAVGNSADKAAAAPKDGPAGPAPGSVPESPSQGAIQGALGAVMGSARACVSGMDEASKANVTFSNDGKVSSVSVSGPAASKPAGGCIKAALMKARVGPFTRPSYSVGVTVRP
jgi:hypothetical protein